MNLLKEDLDTAWVGGVLFLPIKATQWRMKSICLHSQNDFPVLNDSDVPHTPSFYSLYPIEYAH